MLELVADILSWPLLLAGAFFYVVGMVGMNRMPDLFTRMHAVSVSETLGVGLLILGMLLQAGFTLVGFKLVFILALLLVAGPVIAHALARAALFDQQWPLLTDETGRMQPTDPGELFPAVRARLREPLISEQVSAAAEDEEEARSPAPDPGRGPGA